MLLIKSSKLSMPKSFSMSMIWKIMTVLLLLLSLTFTALLFQNQLQCIFPAFFSWRHLYASWWFSLHMLSDRKSLPENFSWRRSSDLFRRFFRLTGTFCFSFLHLSFTITDYFFFKRWQSCKSCGLTSCPVKESALQMFSLSSSSLIDGGTAFISTNSRWWYWALVTAFLFNWKTLSDNNLLQFLEMAKSDETTSNLLKKLSNRFVKSDIFYVMSSTVMSSSISSSFEMFSNLLLVRTILVEDDNRM